MLGGNVSVDLSLFDFKIQTSRKNLNSLFFFKLKTKKYFIDLTHFFQSTISPYFPLRGKVVQLKKRKRELCLVYLQYIISLCCAPSLRCRRPGLFWLLSLAAAGRRSAWLDTADGSPDGGGLYHNIIFKIKRAATNIFRACTKSWINFLPIFCYFV